MAGLLRGPSCGSISTPPPRGHRPQLFDEAVADAYIPVVEVDGGVAMAGDEADLVPAEAVGGARNAEGAAVAGGPRCSSG